MNFNTLPAELQAIVVLKALEVSPHQSDMRLSTLPLYEESTTLKLASISTAFLDHVVVACRSHLRHFIYSFMRLIEDCPQQQEDMVCKYAARDTNDPLASMHTLERALPATSPLFKWLHCEHCDMLERYEKGMLAWIEEIRLLSAQSVIVGDLVKRMEGVRLQVGTSPPPGSRRQGSGQSVEIQLSIPMPPDRS